jgi:hypothetical protein
VHAHAIDAPVGVGHEQREPGGAEELHDGFDEDLEGQGEIEARRQDAREVFQQPRGVRCGCLRRPLADHQGRCRALTERGDLAQQAMAIERPAHHRLELSRSVGVGEGKIRRAGLLVPSDGQRDAGRRRLPHPLEELLRGSAAAAARPQDQIDVDPAKMVERVRLIGGHEDGRLRQQVSDASAPPLVPRQEQEGDHAPAGACGLATGDSTVRELVADAPSLIKR